MDSMLFSPISIHRPSQPFPGQETQIIKKNYNSNFPKNSIRSLNLNAFLKKLTLSKSTIISPEKISSEIKTKFYYSDEAPLALTFLNIKQKSFFGKFLETIKNVGSVITKILKVPIEAFKFKELPYLPEWPEVSEDLPEKKEKNV